MTKVLQIFYWAPRRPLTTQNLCCPMETQFFTCVFFAEGRRGLLRETHLLNSAVITHHVTRQASGFHTELVPLEITGAPFFPPVRGDGIKGVPLSSA